MQAEPSGRQLEERCRQHLSAVERMYNQARKRAARALERCAVSNSEDDLRALEEAHRRESEALVEYMSALRRLRDLRIQQNRTGG